MLLWWVSWIKKKVGGNNLLLLYLYFNVFSKIYCAFTSLLRPSISYMYLYSLWDFEYMWVPGHITVSLLQTTVPYKLEVRAFFAASLYCPALAPIPL